MSFPAEYTPSSIGLFIIDHLMNKCHLMWMQTASEEKSRIENQYALWRFERELDQIEFPSPWSIPPEVEDEEDDYNSLFAEEEELADTEEMTDISEPEVDSVLSVIDWTDSDINLNDLYE